MIGLKFWTTEDRLTHSFWILKRHLIHPPHELLKSKLFSYGIDVCTKANRTLGFLRRNLYSCPQEVKEAAYKGLVCPVLDYGSSVWDPPGVVLQEELENVQKRAARFVTGNYSYETGSMTGILGQLKWESLKKRRKDNRLILLYKGLKDKASVPTDDLIPKTRRCRNQDSMAFQTPIANTDVYVASSLGLSGIWMPSPILWSHLMKMQRIVLLSSLLWWELGTNSLITVLVSECRFGVSPVNYPDPDPELSLSKKR